MRGLTADGGVDDASFEVSHQGQAQKAPPRKRRQGIYLREVRQTNVHRNA